jgi:hypothetical protein
MLDTEWAVGVNARPGAYSADQVDGHIARPELCWAAGFVSSDGRRFRDPFSQLRCGPEKRP